MANITTRQTPGGTGVTNNDGPLSNAQLDTNFINLNTDKLELGGTYSSGTANGVTYLNGSKVLTTSSALTFDGTNLNLGTQGEVRVYNTANSRYGRFLTSSSGTIIQSFNGSNEPLILDAPQSGASIRFDVGSTEQMRLTSSGLEVKQSQLIGYSSYAGIGTNGLAVAGNVGIGTSSPQGSLDVTATGATVNQFLTGGAGNNLVTGIFRIGSGLGRGASIQGFRGASSNVHSLDFYTYNSADVFGMRLDSSGNLGVGTNSPATKLDVNGVVSVAGLPALRSRVFGYSGSYQAIEIGARNSLNGNVALAVDVSAITGGGFSGQNQVIVPANGLLMPNAAGTDFIGVLARDASNRLLLGPGTAGGITSGNVVIDSSGNLGIGTSSPTSRLTIGSGTYSAAGSQTTGMYTNGSNGLVILTDALNVSTRTGGDRLTLDSSGNLGLGVTPNQRLTVAGTAEGSNQLFTSGTDNNYLTLGAAQNWGSNNTAENKWSFRWRGRPNAGGHYLGIYDDLNAQERVRISSDGTFRVKGAGTAGSTDAVQFSGSAPASTLILDSSGNLGIGTSSPGAKLDVLGSGDPTVNTIGLRAGLATHSPVTGTKQYGVYVNQLGGRYADQTGIYVTTRTATSLFANNYFGIEAYSESSSQAYQVATGVYGQATNLMANYGTKAWGVRGVGISASGGGTEISIGQGSWGGHFTAYGKGNAVGVYADAYLDASPIAGAVAIPLLVASNGVERARITSGGNFNLSIPPAAINTTTPGTGTYGLNFTGSDSTDNAQGITWSWSGTTAQAGIYVQSSGAYGTKMYLATTDSFATGAKTAVSIDHLGNTTLNRGTFQTGSVWINNGTNNNTYNENIRLFNAPNGVSVIAFSASGVSGTPTTSILGYSDRQEIRFNDGWQQRVYNGYAEAAGSYRAPVFYDSNDTTFYLDPNSSTTSIRTAGDWRSNSSAWSGEFSGKIQYHSNNWYFQAADQFIWRNSSGTNVVYSNQSGELTAVGNVRSPIFYDSNNTGYYTDPASTSVLNYLQVGTHIEQGNNLGRPNVNWSASGTSTGMVIFYIPGVSPGNYGMLHMVFDIYEYVTGRTATVIIGGHNWSTSWYNIGCNVVGFTNKSIRLGVKDGRYCVVFGTSGSSWEYGTIVLRKVHNAGFYDNIVDMNGNWSATQTTTESFTNVTGDLRELRTSNSLTAGGSIESGADVRAPIFYDSNNTGYYVDPNTTTNINALGLDGNITKIGGYAPSNGAIRLTPNLHLNSVGGNAVIINWDNGTTGATQTLRVGNGASSDVYYIRADGYSYQTSYAENASSFRAPVFYDSNDTNYYVDAASTTGSRLSHLYVGNVAGSNDGGWNARLKVIGSSHARLDVVSNSDGIVTSMYSHTGQGVGRLGTTSNHPLILMAQSDAEGGQVYSGSLRSPIFYDSNNTGYYVDPNTTDISLNMAGSVRATTHNRPGILSVASGTSSSGASFAIQQETAEGWTGLFVDYEPNTGWGLYHDNPNNYFSFTAETSTGSIRSFTVPSRVSGNRTAHEKFRVDQTSGDTITGAIGFANASFRAPIFYDSNDTAYYIDPNSTSNSALRIRGGTLHGPNTTWGAYLYVGTNGNIDVNTATVAATNGNLHLDAANGYVMYLNNYATSSYTIANQSMRSPIFYDNNDTSYYVDAASTSVLNRISTVRTNDWLYLDNNYGHSVVGLYDSTRYQGVFAMGDAYKLPANGTTTGNLYGLAWSHPNAGGIAANLNTHGLLALENGNWLASLTGSTRARDDMRAPIFYDNNDTAYYVNPNSTSYLHTLTLSGASYFRPNNWIQLDSSYGLYWPNHYGAHLHANDLSTYTQIALRGGKNSFGGIFDQYSSVNGFMYDSGGNGGAYREANGRWYFYYHLSNDCLGIGTSTTNSAYGVYCNKGIYANGRHDGTIFYDSENTGYYIDPTSSTAIRTVGSWRADSASWDGEFNGKIQYHSSHWYFQAAGEWYFRNSGGSAVLSCTQGGNLTAAGNVTAYSDIRLKKNIQTIEKPLEIVSRLRGVTFDWIESGNHSYGLIAQEVEQVLPELVVENIPDPNSVDKDKPVIKSVDYSKMVSVLIEAVKEQQKIIDAQENRISRLEALVHTLTQ